MERILFMQVEVLFIGSIVKSLLFLSMEKW